MVQTAARLPAYIVLALLAVAVTAGSLLAARGESPPSEPFDDVVVGDVTETALPTPVPLESATPLPTPVPMAQSATADTAVAFWMEWVPEEVSEVFSEAMVNAYGPRATREATPAQLGPTPEPVAPDPVAPDPEADSIDTTTAAPTPMPLAPAPLATPLPDTLLTPAPLPVPLPSEPITITPTLPPLLP